MSPLTRRVATETAAGPRLSRRLLPKGTKVHPLSAHRSRLPSCAGIGSRCGTDAGWVLERRQVDPYGEAGSSGDSAAAARVRALAACPQHTSQSRLWRGASHTRIQQTRHVGGLRRWRRQRHERAFSLGLPRTTRDRPTCSGLEVGSTFVVRRDSAPGGLGRPGHHLLALYPGRSEVLTQP